MHGCHLSPNKELIFQVLNRPLVLTGDPQPPIEALWAFCYGVYCGLEKDDKKLVDFWKFKKYGARTDYRIMLDKYKTFEERRQFLLAHWTEYFEWIEKSVT